MVRWALSAWREGKLLIQGPERDLRASMDLGDGRPQRRVEQGRRREGMWGQEGERGEGPLWREREEGQW